MLWKDKYQLGVALIDTQQKELFLRVDAFMQTVRATLPWEWKGHKVSETLGFLNG